MSETPDEQAEKATVLTHVAKAAFPEAHLAPWMSILSRDQATVIAFLKTIGDVAEEMDRRAWLDEHPGEVLPEEMSDDDRRIALENGLRSVGLNDEQVKKILELVPPAPEETSDEKEEEEVFRIDRVRGASGMFGFCLQSLARNVHDLLPSVGGIGRRQAMSFGMAQKSGIAIEPKKRSLAEKLTFRGKDKEQVSGGV
jgi:hypothetical protein